jgi:hypothetical protein
MAGLSQRSHGERRRSREQVEAGDRLRYIAPMKHLCTLVLLLAASSLVYADKAPAPAKDAPAKDAPATLSSADVQKWLAFFDKIVDIVVADKADCTKMAGDLNKHIDANAEILKKAAAAKDMKLPKDAEDHVAAGAQKMMGSMQKCGNDQTVQAAFTRLDGAHPKK